MNLINPKKKVCGFSLVELLVVVAVLAILLTLSVPAANQLLSSTTLARSGQQFSDQLVLAWQTAITRNRDVEVRFIEMGDEGDRKFRAMQAWIVDDRGMEREPLGRMVRLPDTIVINEAPANSPLVFGSGATLSGTDHFGAAGDARYVGFRFRANGETDLSGGSVGSGNNFFLLQHLRDPADAVPDDFYAIQINPLTGRVSAFRP